MRSFCFVNSKLQLAFFSSQKKMGGWMPEKWLCISTKISSTVNARGSCFMEEGCTASSTCVILTVFLCCNKGTFRSFITQKHCQIGKKGKPCFLWHTWIKETDRGNIQTNTFQRHFFKWLNKNMVKQRSFRLSCYATVLPVSAHYDMHLRSHLRVYHTLFYCEWYLYFLSLQ